MAKSPRVLSWLVPKLQSLDSVVCLVQSKYSVNIK